MSNATTALNLFNKLGQDGANETIYTVTNNPNFPYQRFDPWNTTPQLGVHYDFGPDYGQVTGVGDYQAPREFSFSVGFRF